MNFQNLAEVSSNFLGINFQNPKAMLVDSHITMFELNTQLIDYMQNALE